jgi:hypothetical protein
MVVVLFREADRAQVAYLHEREEDETGDELFSEDEFDDMSGRSD